MVGGLDETISLKTIANGLKRVKNEGLAKDIGVGNYRLPELRQIHEYLGDDLVYNEVHANLLIREPFENGVYQYCRDNNIVMGAYRPLQLGQLSKSGINILDALSTKYSKSQSEIALKWLLSFQGVITMPKALKSEHIDQLSKINDWTISKDDITELTKNFPLQVSVSDCTLPISKYIK
jgi:diketogulonate reductase-like aldo/keto reductase